MLRRRYIAASPVRRADEAWIVIVDLIADALDQSTTIKRAEVVEAFTVAATVGPRLIAARHLEKSPIVVDADPLQLSIYTVSGVEALSIEENLGPVPGASSALAWKVRLPAAEPLTADVVAAVTGSAHLTTEVPTSIDGKSASGAEFFDFDALGRRLSEDHS